MKTFGALFLLLIALWLGTSIAQAEEMKALPVDVFVRSTAVQEVYLYEVGYDFAALEFPLSLTVTQRASGVMGFLGNNQVLVLRLYPEIPYAASDRVIYVSVRRPPPPPLPPTGPADYNQIHVRLDAHR
ncbi:MAG: hypothetical protein HY220_03140 [Candidatus Sungbacteria bacterium]|uniref:Gingipain propeptide domain-containing protein n=1 Tax=Candidatus Sungiibacteriota bacterium TaxID=2750080 RepID=A0A9D6LU32_9BACT|nr:hypothetical protein [Candidatus Sungbacteria bacterium]